MVRFIFAMTTPKENAQIFLCQSKTERHENAQKLENISADIFKLVPGTAIASDQPYRITDLAIDFAEDVEHFCQAMRFKKLQL